MTINKAIEVLEAEFQPSIEKNETSNPNLYSKSPELVAINLGIEALKRIKSQYDPDHQMMRIPLPGETKD